ncbi:MULTISPECIES: nitrate reductase [unclassified Klebsiella]|uniref:nitrate reductase n=1 Tax=Enterobacteriaceae TaxID=543 RepID=UPI0015DC8198|nr:MULTISPECIES: nitrate reductase [unclassified Klebsiella]HAT3955724.1 molybdopterin-dependent oxidoreductase [Kluyvera ascorbata]BBR58696.1 nitrate reductase [Klebsiella sp. WP4-W18-ESBL-05]BBS92011.1 nitrate reductase [Klebsiella sp. WP7-S18-CRE-02]BBS97033.1 nitrate reductase [Klebsiella sp. WP7-S18-CRE-03]BBT02067.1 nitrate reductase [Klebsiella sp. WP7-S18-ESBL-04]
MRETKTTCPYCGVGCGVVARVEGSVVSVEGDATHPANAGRLCVKGASLAQTIGLEGRLLYPQLDGQAVSWPQALTAAGERLRAIIDAYGPQAVAFYASGQLLTEDYYAANKLMKGFIGAGNIDTNSRLCMSSAVTGYKRAFGADVVPCSYEDVERSDLVILVGSNAAWAHPVLYQRLVQAKQRRPQMKVVVIDPRRTATCDIADCHLAISPGTDGGLFVGLLRALAQAGVARMDYADASAALTAAEGWTVARVAAFCGLSEGEVQAFYAQFIAAPRAITLYTMGINQSSSGSDKCNAIINVHLASGQFGREGCGPFSLTGQPNAMGGREVGGLATMLAAHMNFEPADLARVARFWGTERLAQTPGLMAVDLFTAIGRGDVKAVWIMGTNPAVSLPDSHAVSQALAACPLVIVSEVAAETDTSHYADIRFPALAWGEKNGTVTNSERRISRQRPFLPPPGEARADWWIIAQVAGELGFAEAFGWQHPHEVFSEHAALSGFENHGQRAFDISGLASLTRAQWDALAPVRWPVSRGEGKWDLHRGWRTDGRLRMVPVTPQTMQARSEPLYPLILNSGRVRDQWHTMTRTGSVPLLMQHIAQPMVEISPQDAAHYTIQHGGLARISSPRGVMVARVAVSDTQRPGSLFTPMHWNDGFARQGKVNNLVAPTVDPHSGQPESKQTAVRIAPWQPLWQGELLSRAPVMLPRHLHWWRKAAPGLHHLTLCGERLIQSALLAWCQRQGWQIQVASLGDTWHLLAWHDGQLMLGFWSSRTLPDVDVSLILRAFDEAPQALAERHALLGGRDLARPAVGKIVCSCFSVGEKTIVDAIERQGCATTEALGERLKCGTNCGSCLPELKALLACAERRAAIL